MAQIGDNKEELRPFMDARVLWPPDMPDDMLEDAVKTAKEAVTSFDIETQGKDVARFIKQKFDDKWLPYWHVIVGKGFGSQCNHEARRFIYFYMGKHAFMIYKLGF